MLYVRRVKLAEDVAYPLNPPLFSSNKVTSRKSKKLWIKGPEWNNTSYEKYCITISQHQFPSHFNKRERNEDVRNRGDQRQEQEKVNKGKK